MPKSSDSKAETLYDNVVRKAAETIFENTKFF
jgi:hypothetical protein